ncbi:terminase small subunit [Micromonospora avicenniae]|uniref:terminase small subunit n=1 Tax=Micromonospora avicenniae TaxID=1198245 RepID=UPI003CCC0F14
MGSTARTYATFLDTCQGDDFDAMKDVGPKYLAVLTALGMTPAGRRERKGGASNDGDNGASGNPLLKLVGQRGAATRKHPAA